MGWKNNEYPQLLCGIGRRRQDGRTNSLYCHTVGWANLHGYGEKWGSLDDREIDDLLTSVDARFINYPSRRD